MSVGGARRLGLFTPELPTSCVRSSSMHLLPGRRDPTSISHEKLRYAARSHTHAHLITAAWAVHACMNSTENLEGYIISNSKY